MPIAFDRSVCCDLHEIISREWLITNGVGGYAAGTIPGVLTRMEHGLLVAAQGDADVPQMLLAKIDEEIVFDQRTYELGTNEYRDGTLNPAGFVHLETFRLEEGFPVFTYHLGGIDGIVLEKRIWMPHGQNTTYIQYRLLRRSEPAENGGSHVSQQSQSAGRFSGYSEAVQRILSLKLLPFSTYRPFNQVQRGNNDWHFQVQVHSNAGRPTFQEEGAKEALEPPTLPKGVTGCTIRAYDGAMPYSIFVVGHPDSAATFIPTGVWYWHFLRRHEQEAGRSSIDDLYLPGVISARLWAGEEASLTIIVTTEELSSLNFSMNQLNHSYKRSVEQQRNLLQPQRYFGEGGETSRYLHTLPLPSASDPQTAGEEYLRSLLQAAQHFLVQHPVRANGNTRRVFYKGPEKTPTILSDYFGVNEDTRSTLIALPGLTLVTGRHDEAYSLLRHIARHFKQGLLPDHIPEFGKEAEEGDYGNVDTTLWFFYALDHYLRATHDYELLDELYQKLVDCIDWYRRGTLLGIGVDGRDGLLQAQWPGKALTWMNASVHGVAVTPRQGKPVEVNALWYNALSLLHEWSQRLLPQGNTRYASSYYEELARRCQESFQQRFWNTATKALFDVIDGPRGDDAAIRPNQLLALSLRYPVLGQEKGQSVFTVVTQILLTPYGLRTLAPQEEGYRGQLEERHNEQQQALHQGSVWPWLIGPYSDALLNLQDGYTSATKSEDNRELMAPWWQQSLKVLEPFSKLFSEGVLGLIGGVYDGDASRQASYQVASALSIAELLRVYHQLARISTNETMETKAQLVVTPHW